MADKLSTFDRFSSFFFNGIDINEGDVKIVELFTRWFEDPNGGRPLLTRVVDLGVCSHVEFEFDEFATMAESILSDFISALINQPQRILAYIGLAIVKFREDMFGSDLQVDYPVRVRFVGLRPSLPLANLKSTIVGKLVSVTGYVVRCSSVKPHVQSVNFECPRCGAIFPVVFEDGKFQPPTKCESSQCRAKIFELLRSSAVTVDCQRVKKKNQSVFLQKINLNKTKIQEIDNALTDAGRVPRTVEVELMEDLVESCMPGDVITTVGIVKCVNADHAAGRMGKKGANSMFLLYLEANSVSNTRNMPMGDQRQGEETNSCPFSLDELDLIRTIALDPNCFQWIINSICPSIFGHDNLKTGLALGLFGGTKASELNRDRLSVRSDPHVLVVGDPGLGKSQMLRAAAQLAPRSVYVSANTTTASGLTITVSKESGSGGDVVLEAGALVLSDQGVCCLDEFDKIGCDSHCLLEAMEQQQVSIAKSGIVASLSTRCSVLAAANPVGGHYDCSKTINENLKLSSALLSRFDLVFILLDKPEESHDRMLSKYIMRTHSMTPNRHGANESDECLNREPIPHNLLKKYITYARKYVHPRLTGEGATVLQTLYLKIRDKARCGDSLPITTRQLESLIRLAQARAKIELREIVTEADALEVVALMEQSLTETFRTETGHFDFGRRGMSLAKQVKSFVSELNKIASSKNSPLFQTSELLDIAGRMSLGVSDFHGFLDVLNEQNYLLKKGVRLWHLQTHVSSSQISSR